MYRERIWVAGRAVSVTTLIAIAWNSTSAIIGYLFSKKHSAPEMSVEFVEILPKECDLRIVEQILVLVVRSRILKSPLVTSI